MISDEALIRELKNCILCGSCKAECPTYFLEHSESRSPRGRLSILHHVLKGDLEPSQDTVDRVYSCLLCGACKGTCSAGVDIVRALVRGRGLLRGADRSGWFLRRALSFVLRSPRLSLRGYSILRPLLKPLLVRSGLIDRSFTVGVPLPGSGGSVFGPDDPLKKKGRVVLFGGCSVRYLFPNLGEAFIRVCNRLGYEVVLPKGEVCCGAPLLDSGMIEMAAGFARKNRALFDSLKADALVSLCPTCVITLKDRYPELVGGGIEVMDSVSFLAGVIAPDDFFKLTAVYHDPCHSKYGSGLYEEPRALLKRLGVELKEIKGGCCGFAGTVSLRFRDMSLRLLESRVREFQGSGAEVMVTSCPGCIYQLSKVIKGDRVFHVVEVVDEAISQA